MLKGTHYNPLPTKAQRLSSFMRSQWYAFTAWAWHDKYHNTPERETGFDSLTSDLLQKDITMTNDFSFNKTQAKIHGLSIQVGELFADLYRSGSSNVDETEHALEAYKSLRRALPMQAYSDRHVGSTAAHKATQGA